MQTSDREAAIGLVDTIRNALQGPPQGARPVLIAGHSHMACVLSEEQFMEQEHANRRCEIVPLADPRFFALVGPFPRGPQYWNFLKRHGRNYTVVLLISGNEYNTHLVQRERFDFFLDADGTADETATLVPLAMIQQNFDRYFKDVYQQFIAPDLELINLETPAPKGDNTYIRARIQREPDFPRAAAAAGMPLDKVEICDPLVQLKLWRAMSRQKAAEAAAAGIRTLPVPPESLDEKGFLRPEYWRDDITHANQAYGGLVIDYLARVL